MMKQIRHIALGVVLLCSAGLQAQQLPQFSQYFNDPIAINPAFAGSMPYVDIKFHQRLQWVGFGGGPNTSLISGNGYFGTSNGVGGYLFNDKVGPVRRTGMNLAYSYRFMVAEDAYLRMGLNGSLFQYAMNGEDIDLYEDGDNLIDQSVNSTTWVPDAGFGIHFKYLDFYAALSALQLPRYKVNVFDGTNYQGYLNREHHYYFITGYTHNIDDTWQVKGSGFVHYMVNNPTQFTLHASAVYQQTFELGAAFRNADALIGYLGVQYDAWKMMYSYDFQISDLARTNSGSHELTLGYELWPGGDVKKRYNVKSSGKRTK